MFVHNSGARNVIHLFASWRKVLKKIDEGAILGKKKKKKACTCERVQGRGGSNGGCR